MKRLFYFAAVLPLLLTSCIKEEVAADYDSTPVPLSIKATIDISSESTSRSLVTGDAFGEGSDIGIFIFGTGYTPKVTTYTTTNGTDWTLKVTEPVQSDIYLTNSTATVYGFYPATAADANTITNKTIPITVASSYSTIAADVPTTQADYLYATDGTNTTSLKTVTKGAASASLKFYHALSQLSFVINKADNFGGTGTLTSLTVTATNDNIAGTGTLKLDGTGIEFELNGSQSKSLTMTGSTTINAYNTTPSTNVIAKALVAPFATSQNVTLTMTIDGQNYTGTISGATWAAGTKYTYTVTVGGGTMSISAVSIQDWADGGNGNVTAG